MATIMGLLNQISDEEIVLPAIQRDFVWTEAQTETLLDSIMRGYPIGIALLWETYNDIQYRIFERDFRRGTLHAYRDNLERRRLRVVLDGQQRLQSLYIALHGQRDGRSTYFDVLSGQRWDDAEQERYRFDFLSAEDAQRQNDAFAEGERGEDTPSGCPPLGHAHLNCLGRYTFTTSAPTAALRPLRDPDSAGDTGRRHGPDLRLRAR